MPLAYVNTCSFQVHIWNHLAYFCYNSCPEDDSKVCLLLVLIFSNFRQILGVHTAWHAWYELSEAKAWRCLSVLRCSHRTPELGQVTENGVLFMTGLEVRKVSKAKRCTSGEGLYNASSNGGRQKGRFQNSKRQLKFFFNRNSYLLAVITPPAFSQGGRTLHELFTTAASDLSTPLCWEQEWCRHFQILADWIAAKTWVIRLVAMK